MVFGQEADDDSRSDLQPWTYRSYPETDPCPTQQTFLGKLMRLRERQRDLDDPACAARIARLLASINAYGEERVMEWNPQHRTSERSFSSSEAIRHSEGSSEDPIPPLAERMSTPVPPGGETGETGSTMESTTRMFASNCFGWCS